jgi:hypothetical protein
LKIDGLHPSGVRVTVHARHFVLAGGAINSPALLLRSKAPDPHGVLGKRTFLHPTVISSGLFDHDIAGYAGAPQSIYSDHFFAQCCGRRPFRASNWKSRRSTRCSFQPRYKASAKATPG